MYAVVREWWVTGRKKILQQTSQASGDGSGASDGDGAWVDGVSANGV